jgi:hypothetical protein
MANIKHLIETFKEEEKTYVLSFRCIGGTNSIVEKELYEINWLKVAELTSVYVKNIKDQSFTKELKKLQEKLATFRSNQRGSKIEYTLSVAINYNEVGDATEGVRYMFLPE